MAQWGGGGHSSLETLASQDPGAGISGRVSRVRAGTSSPPDAMVHANFSARGRTIPIRCERGRGGWPWDLLRRYRAGGGHRPGERQRGCLGRDSGSAACAVGLRDRLLFSLERMMLLGVCSSTYERT